MILELLIVLSNGWLAVVTLMVVPEEHRPHLVRKAHHHTLRLVRVALRRPEPHAGRHRLTAEIREAMEKASN